MNVFVNVHLEASKRAPRHISDRLLALLLASSEHIALALDYVTPEGCSVVICIFFITFHGHLQHADAGSGVLLHARGSRREAGPSPLGLNE